MVLLEESDGGGLTTCHDFATFLAMSSSRGCGDFDGVYNGVEMTAYCECPGTTYPESCATGLCPFGMRDEEWNYGGMTCAAWDDFARSIVDMNGCGVLDDARDFCCIL